MAAVRLPSRGISVDVGPPIEALRSVTSILSMRRLRSIFGAIRLIEGQRFTVKAAPASSTSFQRLSYASDRVPSTSQEVTRCGWQDLIG